MGEHSAGGVRFDQTATIFAPLRRIKNTTLTCALTGWKSSASPVRCNNRVWVCPLFGVSFIPWVFSDHGAMCSFKKNVQYSICIYGWSLGIKIIKGIQRIHHWWIGAKAPSFSRIFIHVFDAAHHVFEDLFNGASLKSWGSGPAKTGQTMTEIRIDGSRPEYSTTFMIEHKLWKVHLPSHPIFTQISVQNSRLGPKTVNNRSYCRCTSWIPKKLTVSLLGDLPLKSSAKEATKRKRSKLTFDGPYSACQCHSPDLVQKERQIDKEMSGTAMDRTLL